MPTETDQQFMHRQIDAIERLAEQWFPGALITDGLPRRPTSQVRRFGIQGRHAVISVFATVHEREGQGWWTNLNVGLGFEIRNTSAALHWVNEKNFQALNGRYYVSVAHHGQWCSVIWEHNIWCGLLEGLDGPDPATVENHIAGYLLAAGHEADATARQLLDQLGGRGCAPGEQGLTWVTVNMY